MFDTQAPADATSRPDLTRLRRVQRDLQAAVDGDDLRLNYHRHIDLGSFRHVGNSASIHWTHRKRVLLAPANITSPTETAAVDTGIGGWMLRTACEQAASWPGALKVSVQVAASQFTEQVISCQLGAALHASFLPPERLELTLCEATLLSDDLDLLLSLSAIRDMGVGIALEDFGHTHASLSMIRRLPITALRLDRSLVRFLPDDAEDAAIVRATLDAAHAMGLTVTADGIESEAQRAFLSACGCDAGSGPLFGLAAIDTIRRFA
jgi:EAL domain-containing protein (putative c-di-GMP-specific phosphodiesterase class I)